MVTVMDPTGESLPYQSHPQAARLVLSRYHAILWSTTVQASRPDQFMNFVTVVVSGRVWFPTGSQLTSMGCEVTVAEFLKNSGSVPADGIISTRGFSTFSTGHSSFFTWLLWLPSRISSKSQISDYEFWLLEKQMQEKPPFWSESVTPQRIPKYTGLIGWDSVLKYVLAPDETFDLNI